MAEHLSYEKTLDLVEQAIYINSHIALGIYHAGCAEFAKVIKEIDTPETWAGTATDFDCNVARSCIRGFFRDWSAEGMTERNKSHLPILQALRNEFNHTPEKHLVRVLVPGAGLGRLAYSIGEVGLSVEANDMSYHTLLARMYLFAGGMKVASKALYPWVLNFSNHISRQHHFQEVMIPDVNPSGIQFVNRSMTNQGKQNTFTTGDFIRTYQAPTFASSFSALASCYFIDTAPNFLDYVETAQNCLQAGGIWVNVGPLLWNAEENGPAGNGEGDVDEQGSWKIGNGHHGCETAILEFTAEEVIQILQHRGFTVEKFSHNVGESSYIGNRNSMLQYSYKMAFWIARKHQVDGC